MLVALLGKRCPHGLVSRFLGGVVSGSSSAGGAGGALDVTTGSGANGSGSGAGGQGGTITLTTGTGGNGGASGIGGAGGNMTVMLGAGGAGSPAGQPGTFSVSGGINMLTAAATLSTTINGSVPQAVTSSFGTSAGSVLVVQSPQGGSTSASGGMGGTGGGVLVTAGPGGGVTGGSGTGGQGGQISITAGNGASVGPAYSNGNGGNIILQAGLAGSGGSGGAAGIIQAASTLQVPAGTATAAALQFSPSTDGSFLPSATGIGPTYEHSGTPVTTFTTGGGFAVASSGIYSMTSGTLNSDG